MVTHGVGPQMLAALNIKFDQVLYNNNGIEINLFIYLIKLSSYMYVIVECETLQRLMVNNLGCISGLYVHRMLTGFSQFLG